MKAEDLTNAIAQGSEDHVYHGGDWSDQVTDLSAIIGRAIAIMTPKQRRELMASDEVQEVLDWSEDEDEEDAS